MRVYLCGPINGCTDAECQDWRTAAKIMLPDWTPIDPMERDYRDQEVAKFKEIVESDKLDIDRSDVVLVNYVKPSVGTSMEMLYAWERGKPIIVVTATSAHISPWLRYHATHIVQSFKTAFALLNTVYREDGCGFWRA